MATLKLYPIGIQTFERIIREDKLYIDKTEYIYRMTHTSGTFFFLSRPRRFGKSLLVSTLQSYFEGKKELFKGLAIEHLEKEWKTYPILHFDMSGGKHLSTKELEEYIGYQLEEKEKLYGILKPKNGVNNRLYDLITHAYNQTGNQVVVLIDEYDAPLLDVVHEEDTLPSLRHVMRNFYSPLKMCEPFLRFVFMTGITKFSQLSIFSELNNITNISMDEEYAGICGITMDELLNQMAIDVEMLAKKLGQSKEKTLTALRTYYDGYHFTAKSSDIFNPFSLLQALSKGKLDYYWFETGTPTYLIHMMKKFDVNLTEFANGMEAEASDFDAPTETMCTLTPLLYQSGYITIKSYDPMYGSYVLGIPNKEVLIGLSKALIPFYVTSNTLATNNTIRNMARALNKEQIDEALHCLQTFLSTIPYCENTNYEGHYQQMLYVIFTLLSSYMVDVEVRTAKGRVDMVVRTATHLYLFELKIGKNAQNAMEQINLNEYSKRFALCHLPIEKVGINFEMNTHTIKDWRIE